MLGVIIGVFSVIMLTAIGEGVRDKVTSQVESLGANQLYVLPGKIDTGMPDDQSKLGVRSSRFGPGQSNLCYDDVDALRKTGSLSAVCGFYSGIDRLDDLNLLVSTTGVDEDLPKVNSRAVLRRGRFITRREREKMARVAVIGDQACREIFGGGDPIGRTFRLNGLEYRVVGLLAYRKPENSGPFSEDMNVKIYLPITEMLRRTGDPHIRQITVSAASSVQVSRAERTISRVLKRRHGGEDFTVMKQQDILDTVGDVVGTLTAALGGIAAISLLVGGIGIMNIMLVSVAERTHEIGVRKAIGAKRRDILAQFLVEAMVLCVIGGAMGLGAGIGGSRILSSVFPLIPTSVPPETAMAALLFATAVGAFFGVYPAVKASRLDPIEALRHE